MFIINEVNDLLTYNFIFFYMYLYESTCDYLDDRKIFLKTNPSIFTYTYVIDYLARCVKIRLCIFFLINYLKHERA